MHLRLPRKLKIILLIFLLVLLVICAVPKRPAYVSQRRGTIISMDECASDPRDFRPYRTRGEVQLVASDFVSKLGLDGFRAADFKIETLEVGVKDLDPAFEGYRIVQISDLHLGQWLTPKRLQGVVGLVNQQDPDLLVITGDFISYRMEPVKQDLQDSLSQLKAKDGILAVMGNHDIWGGVDEVRQILRTSQITELCNDVYTVKKGQGQLNIAGVGDVMTEKDRLDLVLKKLPDSGPAMLLVHEPDFADTSAPTGRFFLQLSGHSHGGQVVLPGIGPLVRRYLFYKYPIGKNMVGQMLEYTNRGLGTNIIWLRINCPPEITVIKLHRL